jgi:hypothetical protein
VADTKYTADVRPMFKEGKEVIIRKKGSGVNSPFATLLLNCSS